MPQLQKRLTAVGNQDGRVGDRTMRAWQMRTTQLAKVNVAVHKRTGNTQRSIHPGPISRTSAQVVADARTAIFLEMGTRAHDIRPVHAKVLAWGGPRRLTGSLRTGAKPTMFARSVHHPGTQPSPFLMPAARQAQDDLGPYFAGATVRAWNEAA